MHVELASVGNTQGRVQEATLSDSFCIFLPSACGCGKQLTEDASNTCFLAVPASRLELLKWSRHFAGGNDVVPFSALQVLIEWATSWLCNHQFGPMIAGRAGELLRPICY